MKYKKKTTTNLQDLWFLFRNSLWKTLNKCEASVGNNSFNGKINRVLRYFVNCCMDAANLLFYLFKLSTD